MSTTTRKNGTKVHTPANAEERIAAFRDVVNEKQYAKIDGVMIDLFTASHVVQVFDALNDVNRAKLADMSAPKLVAVVWKLLKK